MGQQRGTARGLPTTAPLVPLNKAYDRSVIPDLNTGTLVVGDLVRLEMFERIEELGLSASGDATTRTTGSRDERRG